MITDVSPAAPEAGSRPGLRILIVQPTGDKMGHYGVFTVKLAHALGKLGHAVTICTNEIFPQHFLREPAAFAVRTVAGGRLAFARFDKAANRWPLYYFWGYYRNSYCVTAAALRLARSGGFDVIYMTDVEFLVAALLLRAHRGSLPPVVMEVSAANFSFADYPGPLWKRGYKVCQREIFRTALGREIAACAVLGEWHGQRLRAQLRVPDAFPIAVIPDGGDGTETPPPAAEACRRLGIDYGGPIFLFFGMLRRDKGIETLLAAVSRLADVEFRLLVAGFPMEYSGPEVEDLVRRAGACGKVFLRLGYVAPADVPAYFGASAALILPYAGSYRGGSGPLLKGACAYGKPVIATAVSGMGQFVEQQAFGLTCPAEAPEALAARMREFLNLPPREREAMGARAAAVGRANSWDAMAERFSDLFDWVRRPRQGS